FDGSLFSKVVDPGDYAVVELGPCTIPPDLDDGVCAGSPTTCTWYSQMNGGGDYMCGGNLGDTGGGLILFNDLTSSVPTTVGGIFSAAIDMVRWGSTAAFYADSYANRGLWQQRGTDGTAPNVQIDTIDTSSESVSLKY